MSVPRPPDETDPTADTGMFRAFANRPAETPRPKAVGAPFRILTLLGGLAILALVIWLLLQS